MSDGGTADARRYNLCPTCQHTPRYCNCGTASASPPGSLRATDDLLVSRQVWPNQPIPGCCGFTKPTGQCCVETNVPQPNEEEDDDGD